MPCISNNEGRQLPPLITVVEYLETSMSKDLLCKFPDNSAFDFDYTQSSIWSPLLPPPVESLFEGRGLELSRKLSYDEMGLLENTKKMAATMKRKFTSAVFDNVHKYHTMKNIKRRNCFGGSSFPSSYRLNSPSPTPKKAWGNVMKAASKHFKKKSKKKDFSNVHLDLSNNL